MYENITVEFAERGSGKTTKLIRMAINNARINLRSKIIVLSLEMVKYTTRLLRREAFLEQLTEDQLKLISVEMVGDAIRNDGVNKRYLLDDFDEYQPKDQHRLLDLFCTQGSSNTKVVGLSTKRPTLPLFRDLVKPNLPLLNKDKSEN